jgi:hypothetical protein
MLARLLRRASAAAVVLVVVAIPRLAHAYDVRVRWQPAGAPDVAGYRVELWPGDATDATAVEVGLPAPAQDGTLSAVVTGLEGGVSYALAVRAVLASGDETPSSNVLHVVDSPAAPTDADGDGIEDATDRCPDTPRGAPVDPDGCACAQLRCEDAGPCALATCEPGVGCTAAPLPDGTSCTTTDPCLADGVCRAGACVPPGGGDAGALTVQALLLRPARGGRAWNVSGWATIAADTGASPRTVVVQLGPTDAPARYRVTVDAERFTLRPQETGVVAVAGRGADGIRHLAIAGLGSVRTVHLEAIVPTAVVPPGATSLTWTVWLGDACASDPDLSCGRHGRTLHCPAGD